MQVPLDAQAAPRSDRRVAAPPKRALMWLNRERVLYVGLLGVPSVRTLGAYAVYLSLGRPHRISVDAGVGAGAGAGPWQTAELSVVPPHVPHRIVSDERTICNLLVEPVAVTRAGLPAWMRDGCGAVADPQAAGLLRHGLHAFERSAHKQFAHTEDFDRAFFGEALPRRPIDPRIGQVLARIELDPDQPHSAHDCAALAHVSVSRFLHLFKAEVGVPFRSFRTWQRARSVLYFVTQTTNLTRIALDAGYPDSTHFSHSIRQVFGLTPRSIFAGCRQLALYEGRALG